MAEPSLTYFSTPVVTSKAPPHTNSFGFTWQEVVTRVEAFGFTVTDVFGAIDNITHVETRKSLADYESKVSDSMFILHPGEYLTKVDVSFTEDVVTALKLHTTKRTTPWYGQNKGSRVTFEAEPGFCINAFCGKYGPAGVSELGVVFAPKTIADEGHKIPYTTDFKSTINFEVDDSDDDDESDDEEEEEEESEAEEEEEEEEESEDVEDFTVMDCRTFDRTPAAIVVKIGKGGVESVRVVTSAEYDRIVRFAGTFEHTPGEQWLVLVEGECIEAVDVHVREQRLKAIRFKTNLQTSHVFGSNNGADPQWLNVRDPYTPHGGSCTLDPNWGVRGFKFVAKCSKTKTAITRFSIVYMRQFPDTAEAQHCECVVY